MWALIYQGKVVDIVSEDPEGKYHPSFQKVNTDDTTKVGMLYAGGKFYFEELSEGQVEYEERAWRDAELVRADEELNKVQDADPKAKGTVGDWRNYRKNLRAYPESEGFPNKESRPVSPF